MGRGRNRNQVGPLQQQQRAGSVQVRQQLWTSPVPPPEELEKYRQVLPDSPERILKMAEKQAEHRQYCEKRMVRAHSRNSTMGVVFAFLLGLTAIGGGIYLISIGQETTGLTSLISGVVSLVGVFIYGARKQPESGTALVQQK